MIRVDGAGPQNLDLPRDARAGGSDTAGAWRGESVRVADSSRSVLQDAAEEITFGHSEKAEEKNIEERKVTAEGPVQLLPIEKIMAYLAEMHREDEQAKLEETASRIINSSGRRERDAASPREEARRSFEDVTEQYCALQFAAHRAKEGGHAERFEAIQEALTALHEDFGPKIDAGLAAAVGARDIAGNAEEAAQFRETYRDVVLGHSALGDTFNTLVERHGLEDFPRAVDALRKSLGEDLSVMRTRDSARLEAIVRDIYNLGVASTVMEQCGKLSQDSKKPFDAMELTREVVNLTGERWVSASRFSTLAGQFAAPDATSQREFQAAFRGLLNSLPTKVFPDPETREALLKASQSALDEAINREEEML